MLKCKYFPKRVQSVWLQGISVTCSPKAHILAILAGNDGECLPVLLAGPPRRPDPTPSGGGGHSQTCLGWVKAFQRQKSKWPRQKPGTGRGGCLPRHPGHSETPLSSGGGQFSLPMSHREISTILRNMQHTCACTHACTHKNKVKFIETTVHIFMDPSGFGPLDCKG